MVAHLNFEVSCFGATTAARGARPGATARSLSFIPLAFTTNFVIWLLILYT